MNKKGKIYKPFSAFTAMENQQLALALAVVQPAINSVLLSGKIGTGKTALIHSFSQIIQQKVIKLPLSSTEDTLIGTFDIGKTMKEGECLYSQSFLEKLNGNILFIDNINLLSSSLLNQILQIQEKRYYISSGKNRLRKPCCFTLFATMNPDEGGIPTKVLDRFSLFVESNENSLKNHRIEILQQQALWKKDSIAMYESYREEEENWEIKILKATHLLKEVKVTDTDIQTIAQLCKEAFIAGHRGDLAVLWASIANASLCGRQRISWKDIQRVKDLALAHRIRSPKEPPPSKDEKAQDNSSLSSKEEQLSESVNKEQEELQSSPPFFSQEQETSPEDNTEEEECFEIGNLNINPQIIQTNERLFQKREGIGKRIKCRDTEGRGRHIRSAPLNKGENKTIDFNASIRAALPYQKVREKGDLAIRIYPEDLHKKIKEHRIGNTILFLVDASGSMGIQQRMKEAKAAVFSLLKDAYVHRDSVGLMTFRKEDVQLVLPPTRSVERAYQYLKDIKTGGRTPLLFALNSALELLLSIQLKNKENIPLLVLFTDGKATSSFEGENTLEQIKTAALQFSDYKLRTIVIDTECGFIRLGYAKKIAEWLNAKYYAIDELKENSMKNIIQK